MSLIITKSDDIWQRYEKFIQFNQLVKSSYNICLPIAVQYWQNLLFINTNELNCDQGEQTVNLIYFISV